MKRIFFVFFLLASAGTIHAQGYKIPVQNTTEGKIVLKNFSGDLPVKGYSGTDIVLSSDRDNEIPARAKGLKAVYSAGTDNTGVAVYMEKNGNQITLTCLLPITQQASYSIEVPDNFAVTVNNECGHAGDVTVSNVKGEVDVTNCSDITLKNVSGPMVLSSISGDINVAIADVKKDNPISVTSISGNVDVSMPAASKADLQMENTTGAIYSDFDFPSDDQKMRKIGGNSIHTQLGGGGAAVRLTSISGNIYLRKKG